MARTEYAPRLRTPTYLERDRDNPIELAVYRDGQLATPSSGTLSVYDASNVAVVNAQAVTVTGQKATYTVTAATLASYSYGASWRVEWTLVMPDALTYLWRTDAMLVRVRLYPVVSDADLYARHADLASRQLKGFQASWQDKLDEAWADLDTRLVSRGRRPYLILSPSALRGVHLYRILALIYRDLQLSGAEDDRYGALADHYDRQYEAAWAALTFEYDADDDGASDGARRRTAGSPTIWLTGRA